MTLGFVIQDDIQAQEDAAVAAFSQKHLMQKSDAEAKAFQEALVLVSNLALDLAKKQDPDTQVKTIKQSLSLMLRATSARLGE